MSLIIFLVVGLIAGALASYILGRQQDLLINLLIGIIGAVVGAAGRPPRPRRLQCDRRDHHRHHRCDHLHFGVAAHSLNVRREWIGEQACGVKPGG
jgi:predicted lipid-binding transport protein (Tim44 family)